MKTRKKTSRHPLRTVLVGLARLPALADRRGMRWLLNGKVMPGGPIVLITYRGRRTGKVYTRPVEALVEDGDRGELVLSPMRGERSDWYRSVLSGGLIRIRFRGASHDQPGWRELTGDERREALARYVSDHSIFGRLIVWGMAQEHRGSGDRLTDAAKAPLVAIKKS